MRLLPSFPQTLQLIAGVCQTSAQCTGTASSTCPDEGLVCCSAACAGDGFSGTCRWTSDCGGATADGLCPGGSQFKCCDAGQAYGPYDAPAVPEVGSCKAVTVEGTRKIIDAFPGRIWSAGCYREGTCSDGSEHPCGRAIDLMCSDEAGVSNAYPGARHTSGDGETGREWRPLAQPAHPVPC